MELNSVELLIRLIFAHIVADFILQPKWMVDKKKNKNRLIHILHGAIQGLAVYIAVWNFKAWYVFFVLLISHLCIDYWKVTKKERLCSFIVDQCLHLFVIILLWIFVTNQSEEAVQFIGQCLVNKNFWIILTGYLFVFKPTSIFLYLFTKRWKKGNDKSGSLQDAGKWIGYLERFLILTFILMGVMQGIGFLLAAKSVFRFGSLNDGKELRNTEYILIGTLASFVIAILIGLVMAKSISY